MTGGYFQVMFGLLASGGNWMTVLECTDLPLFESMCFALRFLNTKELNDIVIKRTKRLVVQGRLDGK